MVEARLVFPLRLRLASELCFVVYEAHPREYDIILVFRGISLQIYLICIGLIPGDFDIKQIPGDFWPHFVTFVPGVLDFSNSPGETATSARWTFSKRFYDKCVYICPVDI